jgi:glycosyltransferase involved in cell wall biosynthesis
VLVYNRLNRWSLRGAHRVVTVCRPFALELERTGVRPERISIVHNIVKPFQTAPAEEVCRLRARLGIPREALVILCVGRLSREKGHADLIAAVAALRQRSAPAFRLVLAGDGPERARLERQCADLKLGELVILAGHQPELAPYYSMADLVALPSYSEGSPNVLLEAMAAGLPAVATAVGGVPEIAADEENALLVRPHAPEALGAALLRLLTSEDLRQRLGTRAREVTLRHTPQAYCQGMLRVYQDLLGVAPALCSWR